MSSIATAPTVAALVAVAAEPVRLNIVVTGHVDHGKSTVIGRLLADTGSLPEGKLEHVRSLCERTARPFEYAFLLDALRDEREQGITIDVARVFFKSAQRQYVILDAPGHVEFLKNMITGAAHADAALLVIDANEGIRETSRRHGYLLSLLGVRQILVLVNKMDLVDDPERTFTAIADEFRSFLRQLDIAPAGIIPVSGREGDNVARRSERFPWYGGPSLLDALDALPAPEVPTRKPFRLPVQGVYKFTANGDDRRIVAGTVVSGTLVPGDDLVFHPSGKRTRARSIEAFNTSAMESVSAGWTTGLTLDEQIYIARGELVARVGESQPHVTTRLRASVFWLGREPLVRRKDYILKLGSARVTARIESIQRVIDGSTLETMAERDVVPRHAVADCIVALGSALAFDVAADIAETGRFVLVDQFEIRGGGIILEALPGRVVTVRERSRLRDYLWEPSAIAPERRAERYGQQPTLVLITGAEDADHTEVGRALEARLFADGRVVYSVGIDADLRREQRDRPTQDAHMRRLAEIGNLMLDAGHILVVTASQLGVADLAILRAAVEPERVVTIWLGTTVPDGLSHDLQLAPGVDAEETSAQIVQLLHDRGTTLQSWL